MATPLPLPTRLMRLAMVRHFLHHNTDFRKAPLIGVFLACPYLLVIATYDRGYILDHLVPAVPDLTEGSTWGITNPQATIVLTQNNHAPALQIDDWIRR